jgi:hypothetical protein
MFRRSCAAFVGLLLAASSAHAAPLPLEVARCGDSRIEIMAAPGRASTELRATVVTGAARWRFAASVGLVRLGARTRTITVEEVRTQERRPPRDKDVAPSALFIDLLLDEKKLILRHASEGGSDPDYAIDLDKCSFGSSAEAVLVSLQPASSDASGCADDTVTVVYLSQVTRVATLAAVDAEREAKVLCEDHQKTIEARHRLEQAISDRAAHDRIAARGPALLRTEDTRMAAWNRIDGCLAAEPPRAQGVAGLHDAEARTRACYTQVAARP